jgi:hypothetical protein
MHVLLRCVVWVIACCATLLVSDTPLLHALWCYSGVHDPLFQVLLDTTPLFAIALCLSQQLRSGPATM